MYEGTPSVTPVTAARPVYEDMDAVVGRSQQLTTTLHRFRAGFDGALRLGAMPSS
ncbi:hypothetical protein [Streptomyces microflavus]|uniref:hypothetical protein n=1 Tax=Streptomyces microflavus TaxID=1919 RepID=UPI003D9DF6F5